MTMYNDALHLRALSYPKIRTRALFAYFKLEGILIK